MVAALSSYASDELATGSNAPAEVALTLEQVLGREVRQRRGKIGLTASGLAGAAGISPGMLSKIESGTISASLTTIQALARALNLPVAALFTASESRRDCSYVRRGTGVQIERRGTKAGHRYQLLGHSLSGEVAIEPYLITLTAEAVPYTGFQHVGIEMIYMLSGRVTYRHGDKLYPLEPGDTLLSDAAALHGPEELLQLPMTYLSVIVYPKD